MKFFLLLFLVFLTSCSLNSPKDFRYEGETLTKSLTQDLKKIHTKNQLKQSIPSLRKKYLKIAKLLVLGKEFQKKHPKACTTQDNSKSLASDELLQEMDRLYQIAGARELMEKAQEEALFFLENNIKHKK